MSTHTGGSARVGAVGPVKCSVVSGADSLVCVALGPHEVAVGRPCFKQLQQTVEVPRVVEQGVRGPRNELRPVQDLREAKEVAPGELRVVSKRKYRTQLAAREDMLVKPHLWQHSLLKTIMGHQRGEQLERSRPHGRCGRGRIEARGDKFFH